MVSGDVITVGSGGNLQAAINSARPGDTLLLQPGAAFVGNFTLPDKGPTTAFITIRSAASDAVLPRSGVRISPADAPNLPKIRSGNTASALTVLSSAHHYVLQFLEFQANAQGYNDIISLGDGSTAQNSLAAVPHDLVLDRVLVRGDRVYGQKRGIALNAAAVTIRNSFISDCKGVGMDTQPIAAWNTPGPLLIENNYLEGAGENILIGGADPRVNNMVPSDIVIRRNHLRKPTAWRTSIFATPVVVSASAGSGGHLGPGQYAYRVIALGPVGQGTTGRSDASREVTIAVAGSGASVQLTWTAVPNAASYQVYGRAAGAENQVWTVTAPSFTDTGSAGASSAVPVGGTTWTVKNLLELKNARRVLIEGNVLEYNWPSAQAGHAVLFTVRNQEGTCPWCEVSDVTFQLNTLRHVPAGFNILGYDDNNPSQRTRAIRIRNNLVSDVDDAAWGGNGLFVVIGNQAADITLDHNTIQHTGTVVLAYGGTAAAPQAITGFVFTNNLSRHNAYGIIGDNFGVGTSTINAYFPNAVIAGNVLAGGNAAQYPPGNLFPTISQWQGQFATLGADFTLVAGSPYRGAGTDGQDIGADIARVSQELTVAVSGDNSGVSPISRPLMNLDGPAQGETVTQPFVVAGWALDLAATSGTGVDVVHVYAYPNPGSGQAPIFLGAASYGIARPDVASAFGRTTDASGFGLYVSGLAAGTYDLVAFARSTVSGTFNNAQAVTVRASGPASAPRMWVDVPSADAIVDRAFRIAGWAVDLGARSGSSGVDVVNVWAYPRSGADQSPVFLGAGPVAGQRADVANAFGTQFAPSGFDLVANAPAAGEYDVVVFAHSTVTGSFNNSQVVRVTVR